VNTLAAFGRDLLVGFNFAMLGYFALLNVIYSVLLVYGWREISDYVRRRPLIDYETIATSETTTPMTILVPAYNEMPVIVQSVKALLRARYPSLEVVIINDGSTDETLQALIDGFALVQVERVPRANLECNEVIGVYACPLDDRLVVIDKLNGGKGDALNAGLRYARYPLFCSIDSDTMIDDDALVRLARSFQTHPETIACGGVVRIVNGSKVHDGHVVAVETPRSVIVNVQIVEYLRAFLTGRTGWARLGALLIISGAFGVFRRDVVIACGGYDHTTVGEDAELVVRMHRHCCDNKIPYRVAFLPDPVCWTEAPSSMRVLGRQRKRWHRGLVETLWRHRGMIGRRRYGTVGMLALPYFVLFEALGPLIELVGYSLMVLALSLGVIDPGVALLMFALALTYGLVLSFGALLVEERAFCRYRRWRCVLRLAFAAFVENFGYRQYGAFVRAMAYVAIVRRRKSSWGEMTRKGYTPASK
jgi:cellulose synthase/poly-beta-1,6-N-acetylglucosamine synthase-like glycosyltransferase